MTLNCMLICLCALFALNTRSKNVSKTHIMLLRNRPHNACDLELCFEKVYESVRSAYKAANVIIYNMFSNKYKSYVCLPLRRNIM